MKEPYYTNGNQMIYLGDCLEVLKEIPDKSFNLIITSPPYNVGMPYETDDKKNYQDYLKFIKKVLFECYRVLIDGGRIAINLPSSILQSSFSRMSYLSLDYVLIMREIGFLDREWIGWIKTSKGEIPGKSTSWGSWRSPSCPYCRNAMEYIIVMDKKQHKRTDKKGKNDITAKEFLTYSSNCWFFPPEHNRTHPAPFPIELPYRLMKFYSWKNDSILDPFMGSGTTLVAARLLKRRAVGIEISEKYCKIAIEKLQQELLF